MPFMATARFSEYTNDMILGHTKKTVKVGTPDHLKLVSDNITTLPNSGGSCGQVRRSIKWRVVDQVGRGVSVGGRSTKWNNNTEFFADGTIREP